MWRVIGRGARGVGLINWNHRREMRVGGGKKKSARTLLFRTLKPHDAEHRGADASDQVGNI